MALVLDARLDSCGSSLLMALGGIWEEYSGPKFLYILVSSRSMGQIRQS